MHSLKIINDMLSEEVDIDSDDGMDLEIEGETASEELSSEMSESESESETSVLRVDGWEDMTWVTRNPRHTRLLKMQGHNLTFCQMQSPWIILFYFSMKNFK
jgi:hypothetical protein